MGEAANMIDVVTHVEHDAEGREQVKVYDVRGVLFFGSASKFLELFDVEADPEEVRLVFESSYISDHSALEALNKLGERYGELGKRVTLQLLHPGSSRIVHKAENLLVKELTLASASERLLDSPRYRRNVEGFRQSFTAPDETQMNQADGEEQRVRHRAVSASRAMSSDLPQ